MKKWPSSKSYGKRVRSLCRKWEKSPKTNILPRIHILNWFICTICYVEKFSKTCNIFRISCSVDSLKNHGSDEGKHHINPRLITEVDKNLSNSIRLWKGAESSAKLPRERKWKTTNISDESKYQWGGGICQPIRTSTRTKNQRIPKTDFQIWGLERSVISGYSSSNSSLMYMGLYFA